jgi:hypothetical protein
LFLDSVKWTLRDKFNVDEGKKENKSHIHTTGSRTNLAVYVQWLVCGLITDAAVLRKYSDLVGVDFDDPNAVVAGAVDVVVVVGMNYVVGESGLR